MIEDHSNVTNENEDILIKGCIAWDRQSQNRLYDLFCAKMLAVCYRYSSSREEAEDTFHEGFMKVSVTLLLCCHGLPSIVMFS